jgi:hypothetical protein
VERPQQEFFHCAFIPVDGRHHVWLVQEFCAGVDGHLFPQLTIINCFPVDIIIFDLPPELRRDLVGDAVGGDAQVCKFFGSITHRLDPAQMFQKPRSQKRKLPVVQVIFHLVTWILE